MDLPQNLAFGPDLQTCLFTIPDRPTLVQPPPPASYIHHGHFELTQNFNSLFIKEKTNHESKTACVSILIFHLSF